MLLKNENLDFNQNENSLEKLTDAELNDKYDRGELRIITEQGRYPLQNIKEILSKNMKFDPEYQRRRVWTPAQKSKLIESFIINIPVPPVFLYEIEYSSYEVMDGLQRLSTLYEFYDNKFELTQLEVWSELNGMKYTDLPEKVRQGIDRRYISTIVILKETAKSPDEEILLKKYVFERLNTGGTHLTDQEKRNALLNGKMNDLCIKIAKECTDLQKAWNYKPMIQLSVLSEDEEEYIAEEIDNSSMYTRMEDVELVLRFFAYRHIERNNATRTKDILDSYLALANENYGTELLTELESLFYKVIKLANEIFGDRVFKMYKRNNGTYKWYNKPSKIIYDPLMFTLSKYAVNDEISEKLISKQSIIGEKFEELLREKQEAFDGKKTNKSDVKNRIELLENMFDSILTE